MTTYYASEGRLTKLLSGLKGVRVFGPVATDKLAWVDSVEADTSLEPLRQPRAAQSPKGFFLPAAESMGRYGKGAAVATGTDTAQMVLVGVRACELRARNYLDKVMLEGDFDDPTYRGRRDCAVIVSCDCVDCAESCFCTLLGGRPFATEGFDINLSPVRDGFVMEVGTEKGQKLLDSAELPGPSPAQLAQRDKIRQEMTDRVAQLNAGFGFSADDTRQPGLPEGDDAGWQDFAADCVECAACTNICPTCYCFYLYDQALGPEAFERIRTWDSCLLSSYHRMAGGVHMKLTPRPQLSSRLANRVLHKFTYSPQQVALLSCVGCGRCIDACLGAIDIREVIQQLGK